METKNFKSVAFGGFDKEEVIHYIQQTAQEHLSAQEALEKENEDLRTENGTLKERLEHLQQEQELAFRAESDRQNQKISSLTAELEALRPQAEAYQKVREEIGDIECQARKRACELEMSTTERLNTLVSGVQRQYQALADSFNATADQVSNELRKVEVNLSQLPRALDQTGSDLDELLSALRGKTEH